MKSEKINKNSVYTIDIKELKKEHWGYFEFLSTQQLYEHHYKEDNKLNIIKIYNSELYFLLTENRFKAINKETQKNVLLNGFENFKIFFEGYKEGVKYFNENYKVNPNTLLGENAKEYVLMIHENALHNEHKYKDVPGSIKGWYSIRTMYPFVISERVLKKYGYFIGICNEVDKVVKNHNAIFRKYESHCIEKTPQPDSSESSKEFEENPQSDIFTNGGFYLFKAYLNKYPNDNYEAGLSFLFRAMKQPFKLKKEIKEKGLNETKYIIAGNSEYLNFASQFGDINQLRSFSDTKNKRLENFIELLKEFQEDRTLFIENRCK